MQARHFLARAALKTFQPVPGSRFFRPAWVTSKFLGRMSDKFSLAFDALSECETVLRRFERFAVKQPGGHILEDTGFYDRQLGTQGQELATAIARLRGPLAAIESEIAAFWPLLDVADRNIQVRL